ncbi:glycoside hydrolase [Echria macrotheca]|uniref:glucan endo-1,6-beta-glucosidase n=1 Tax=Echria macrotheca TaxID=438768 RepID=A0AAJ0FAB1_9PEZI|nr:glycoside hydrolase [Echria macrotheca]
MRSSVLSAGLLAGLAHAWLPHERHLPAFNISARFEQLGKRWDPKLPSGVTKIRGVNFGGWLISEPWMMCNEWTANMGCGTGCSSGQYAASEFDCMLTNYKNNRAAGNAAFAKHWQTWITPDTVQSVHDVGLNTIRIPIGYWSFADIVDKSSEPFADPAPMLAALDAVIQKCADLGIYVIMDLHGAPGGQQEDPFTGQNNKPAGFFNDYNFGRAEKWLDWMTRRIHSTPSYRAAVGMIEVLNEPVSRHDPSGRYPAPGEEPGLTQTYYPAALQAVRAAESSLGVSGGDALHVMFMDGKWLSGDPRSSAVVAGDATTAFDDHNYIGFGQSDQSKLMNSACTDDRTEAGEDFKIVGEWSLVSDVDWPSNQAFFSRWFTAQQQLYEKPGIAGWVYWTWKTELNDPRWTYSHLTALKWIPTDAAGLEKNVFQQVC